MTDYLEHIVKSLKNNYQIDLNEVGEVEDPRLDSELISGSVLVIKLETEPVDRESEFTHRTEVKKTKSEIFGETFTIHKRLSEFQEKSKSKTKKPKSKSKSQNKR